MSKIKDLIKKYIFFIEPEEKHDFFLRENEFDKKMGLDNEEDISIENEMDNSNNNDNSAEKNNDEEDKKQKTKKKSKNLLLNNNIKLDAKQPEIIKNKKKDLEFTGDDKPGPYVYKTIDENLAYLKKRYSTSINGDFMIREFDVVIDKKPVQAFIIFFDGMVNSSIVNTNILQPLMLLSNLDIKSEEKDILHYIRKHLLPQHQVKYTRKMQEVIDEVNFGSCALFVDGIDVSFLADVKGWEHRGVEKPTIEFVLRGPQEGFTELLRANTALIRKILKDADLICEGISIGIRSKTACSIMYIKNIANDSLVNEVRRRLKSVKIDYLIDSGELEQFIEDKPFSLAPQVAYTERPDTVASALADGKVAVIVNGSPFVLIMPTTIPKLFHSEEDKYVRFPYANLFRVVRYIGVGFSLFLPALYIAITNFHQEMIPTDLLLSIEASREKVPFPSVVEILIMELAFELIREAGVRIPGPIGPTLGIIGGLILGQAAVEANIVSPILIIIVAVTGLGSFAIPSFSLGFYFRIIRFFYIILASLSGFLGITTGVFIHLTILSSTKSFGVPILAPIAPRTAKKSNDTFTKKPIWKEVRRPDYLSPKDDVRQNDATREWEKN